MQHKWFNSSKRQQLARFPATASGMWQQQNIPIALDRPTHMNDVSIVPSLLWNVLVLLLLLRCPTVHTRYALSVPRSRSFPPPVGGLVVQQYWNPAASN